MATASHKKWGKLVEDSSTHDEIWFPIKEPILGDELMEKIASHAAKTTYQIMVKEKLIGTKDVVLLPKRKDG